MKTTMINAACVLTLLGFLGGCQGGSSHWSSSQSADARMNAAIKNKFAEEKIDLTKVGVDTQDGHVYLSGVVPTSDEKARAEQIARNTVLASPAVNWLIVNQLQVRPVIDDAVITSSIKGRLMNDRQINASQIAVDTQQGIVSLNGSVPSPDHKFRAETLSREIPGVRQVVNNLQVPPVPPATGIVPSSGLIQNDPLITATVKERLTTDRIANLARVHVDTTEGTVYLNGVVPSSGHKVRAEQIARDVSGVTQVVNNLQVQP
ncbi:hypothetical protein W02_28460 [Nitrospira sp. KM1]|uniref:BON domain-containing protein n=1 Tax=Nitrospira sp. KM1 TaxID=1936990 RepID=UPI0013A7A828|nr:BON domain-containing protein [Nitrospira sp. KM1]BCA55706.1 hypothetical protein W02_28460 [Nitrospira sp. KM1]